MRQIQEDNTLCAWLERRAKAKQEAEKAKYKPVVVNMTNAEFMSFEEFAEELKNKGLIATTNNARGLILKRALSVYQRHVASISASSLSHQHEQAAIAKLRKRKKPKARGL